MAIPRLQAVPLPGWQVSFQRDEREILRYWFDPASRRPFLYPLVGPGGRTLTRMGHPGDPDGHSHHNSVWFSLSKVDGADFWSDRGEGRIVHQRTVHLGDGDESALAVTEANWVKGGGAVVLRERRLVAVRLLPRGEWLLTLELLLTPLRPLTLEPALFGPVGVRMAKWIGAFHGGGRILNSFGAETEPGIFRKPARWVDYSGQVADGVVDGIALFDHPSNPHHPSPFHVREDGWMGAMLSMEKPASLAPDRPLTLRYGLYVHACALSAAAIEERWMEFAAAPARPALGPPGSEKDCRHGGHKAFTVPREFASAAECNAAVVAR